MLFDRARQVMPGGVNSPVRAFGGVSDAAGGPRFIVRGEGCTLIDADGKRYLDLLDSWGPLILGHCHPEVLAAVERAAKNGTSFGACSPLEIELAERVCALVPSVEMVRMTSSGTEATMAAVRLARAVTGRAKIIKFEGCYHGHSDGLLVAAGSGVATHDLPDAMGVPGAVSALTLQAPYNDADAVAHLFEADENKDAIACVIVEPVAGNMGVVLPRPGFLARLRELCDRHGALLIFDEVMTGFRVALGGYQSLCGVTPDLTTMGKIIGGGLPVGAFGGSRALMENIAPAGGVYHAGTLSGNPLAMAAGIATLDVLARNNGQVYDTLEARGARLGRELESTAKTADIPVTVQRQGSMLTLFFTETAGTPLHDFAQVKACGTERFGRYFAAMLQRGVYLPPSAFEAWFLSTALGDSELDQVLAAHRDALTTLG